VVYTAHNRPGPNSLGRDSDQRADEERDPAFREAEKAQAVSDEDAVNHPAHYAGHPAFCEQCEKQIECIDVAEHLSFNIGNSLKYLWRHGMKGDPIEDLKKAQWYIEREIHRLEKKGKQRGQV
jgi:hypothetical protein